MRLKNTLFLLLACSLLTQCKKPGCFGNNGDTTTVKRTIAAFHQIDLFSKINLILTQSTDEALTVEAGTNVHPNLFVNVDNGILTIRNNGTCDWLQNPENQINVYVSFKTLDRINYNGSGSVITTNTIVAENFTIYSEEGAGNMELQLNAKNTTVHLQGENPDVILHGKSDNCRTFVHSRGTINYSDFEVKDLHIGYTSVRDAIINVTSHIYAIIYHTGNLYYKKDPLHIETTYYSSGRLLKKP
jgi:hypothetical protein